MQTLTVDIWSDIACPWCYVGKRRFEAALRAFPHKDHVHVTWRFFELDPAAPAIRPETTTTAQHLAAKYGVSATEAKSMLTRMTETAAAEGLAFDFDKQRGGNTFDAHRVLHLAKARGKQDAVKERIMRAYFGEGAAIGDKETIARLAVDAGLDGAEVNDVLHGDAYADAVRADEAEARAHGINGVPFFGLAGRFGVSGAQPADVLGRALELAWNEAAATPSDGDEGAPACGPDGCP